VIQGRAEREAMMQPTATEANKMRRIVMFFSLSVLINRFVAFIGFKDVRSKPSDFFGLAFLTNISHENSVAVV